MPKSMLYKCNLCSATRTINANEDTRTLGQAFPETVPCGWRGCKGYCVAQGMKTPEEVLVAAKLAGTDSPSHVPMTYEYVFRSNEQAAKLAISALEEAGYKIVPIKRTIVENSNTYCIVHDKYVGVLQMFRCETGVQRDEACAFEER